LKVVEEKQRRYRNGSLTHQHLSSILTNPSLALILANQRINVFFQCFRTLNVLQRVILLEHIIKKANLAFLEGGGEMGELTRQFDWTSTSIGAPENWPYSLRVTVSNLLRSRFPMFLWWGDDMIQFYNDAYRPSLGNSGKHPAIGQKGMDTWPEIWDIISPLHEQVRVSGEPTWREDQLIPIYRNGRLEDVYWTFSYSSVLNDDGEHGGILVTCVETTEKVKNYQELLESEDSLRFAIEATELGTWDYNPTTNLIYGNNRLRSLFGVADDKAIDLNVAINVVIESDRDRVQRAIERALLCESGGEYDITYTIVRPDQNKRIVRSKGRAWFNDDRICYRFNGTLQDVTEQHIARQKADDSAQQLRAVVDSAPFPIGVYVGREMRITVANPSILKVWDRQDVIGKRYAEVLPELENQQIYDKLDAVYMTGVPFHARHQRVDLVVGGSLQPFYFNYSFTPLFDADRKVYGVMNTAADVTDIVKAKLQVEQSEERFQNLIRNSSVGMVILHGPEMIVTIANAAYGKLLNRTVDELLNRPLFDVIPDAAAVYQPMLDNVRRSGEPVVLYAAPYVIMSKGEKIEGYLNVIYQPFRETDGSISGVIALCQDVTEQVLARKRIEEVEERAKLAIASAQLGTFEVDLVTNYVYTSQRMDEIFEVESTHDRERYVCCIHPDDLEIRKKAYEASFETGFLEYEARLLTKSQQVRWIRAQGRIFFDHQQTPVKLAGVVQDITEEKLFYEELSRLVKERTSDLEQSNNELQQFAHVTSHDLKEPVRKILTFNSRLEYEFGQILPERARTYIEKINRAANRIYAMIEGILLYSSINTLNQPDEPVDLNGVLKDIQDDLEVLIQQKAATIYLEKLPVLQGSAILFYQLFYNLVNNSIKFTADEKPPVIHIRAKEEKLVENNTVKSRTVITVEDNGIGFKQVHAKNIFETFSRLHSKDVFEGTGLGLALCKKIVERYGGHIHATSEEGSGALITIELPMQEKTDHV
jgi:PAS domain S-box-containing protein